MLDQLTRDFVVYELPLGAGRVLVLTKVYPSSREVSSPCYREH